MAKLNNPEVLWREIIKTYALFNSKAARGVMLTPRNQATFDAAVKSYSKFVVLYAKATGKKNLRLTQYVNQSSYEPRTILNQLQMGVDTLDRFILKRAFTLSLSEIVNRLLTTKSFNAALAEFERSKQLFSTVTWEVDNPDDNVVLNRLNSTGLNQLFYRLPASGIVEIVLPQLNAGNAKNALDALAKYPAKAYSDEVLNGVVNLYLSGRVSLSGTNMLSANPQNYWAGIPRNKVKSILSWLSDNDLIRILPFMNLTYDEVEKLLLYVDAGTLKLMARSKYPAVRSFWIASQRYAVLPILFQYDRLNWPMSPKERNLVNLYKTQVSLSLQIAGTLRVGQAIWVGPNNLPPKVQRAWSDFSLATAKYADLSVQLAGAYLVNGRALVVYATMWGDLASRRDDADILSYFVVNVSTGQISAQNVDPAKDSPVSNRKWPISGRDVLIGVEQGLSLAQ